MKKKILALALIEATADLVTYHGIKRKMKEIDKKIEELKKQRGLSDE